MQMTVTGPYEPFTYTCPLCKTELKINVRWKRCNCLQCSECGRLIDLEEIKKAKDAYYNGETDTGVMR